MYVLLLFAFAVHTLYGWLHVVRCACLCQMLADDWTSLGDVQYRKIHLYDLDWAGDEDRQLDRNVVAVAKYGGAVAMMRDETKLLKVCYYLYYTWCLSWGYAT